MKIISIKYLLLTFVISMFTRIELATTNILRIFDKYLTATLNIINMYKTTWATIYSIYPEMCYIFVNVCFSAYYLTFYIDTFYSYTLLSVFTISVITIFHICFTDLAFANKYPYVHRLLLVICGIAILFSIFILCKLAILKLINDILKTSSPAPGRGSYDPSAGDPSAGDPSAGDPSARDPSGGDPSGGGPFGETKE